MIRRFFHWLLDPPPWWIREIAACKSSEEVQALLDDPDFKRRFEARDR